MTPLFKVRMSPSASGAVGRVLSSGWIGEGKKVLEFEKALEPWVGRRVVAVNSCTSAIQLALRLSGVGVGDEVITTPMTCTATNVPILACGGKIVWADVDGETGHIDPWDVKKKITSRTKAVLAVHWGGRACALRELVRICDGAGIKLIEDAAHALGARYDGQPIGSHGDFVCFSFQAIKHVTTGDGGALTCRDEKDDVRARLLRWYGFSRRQDGRPSCEGQDPREWGYKFHMNDLAASVGLENLKGLKQDLVIRRRNAAAMHLFLRSSVFDGESAFWFMPTHRHDRSAFESHLRRKGIGCGVVHERNDRYRMFPRGRDLPGVDRFCRTQVNLPVGAWVDTNVIAEAVLGY